MVGAALMTSYKLAWLVKSLPGWPPKSPPLEDIYGKIQTFKKI
jgi:hypothetical protein